MKRIARYRDGHPCSQPIGLWRSGVRARRWLAWVAPGAPVRLHPSTPDAGAPGTPVLLACCGRTLLPQILLLVCVMFARAAPAQESGSVPGAINASIGGGLDGSVHAEVSKPSISGGGAPGNSTPSSKWSVSSGQKRWDMRSGGSEIGSWSLARKGSQSSRSGLSRGPADAGEQVIGSPGSKPKKARPEMASKNQIGAGPVITANTGLFGFTGRIRHSSGGNSKSRTMDRQKIAMLIKGRGSPRLVSKRRHLEGKEKPVLSSRQNDRDNASKLRLRTWLSGR